jgi:ankyrin repeat protein
MRYLTSVLLLLLATGSFAQGDASVVDLIRTGDRAGALELIRLGADVNAAQADGSTALHWAVHNVDEELTELLLSREADPAVKNRYGATPLAEAVRIANKNLVLMLLEAGADPEATNEDGQTALMLAASTGVVDVAELLLDAGADVNATEQWRGQTALMWAASNAHGAMAELLIERGANVSVRAASTDWGSQITTEPRAQYRPTGGLTPLLYAARSGCELCIEAMLDAEADIDFPTPEAITPLMVAIDNYRYDAAKLLLERGANSHVWDWWGRTALYVATDMNSYGPNLARGGGELATGTTALDLMRMLLDAGVNRDPQLNMHRPGRGGNSGRFVDDLLTTGATPLLRAANSHDLDAVKLLLEYGAQVDLPNVMGVTPLLAAAGFGNARGVLRGTFDPSEQAKVIPVLEVLLAAGADIDATVADTTSHNAVIARMSTMTAREGHNVLFAAAMQNWNDVVTYLVEQGADLTVLDANGKSLLDAVKGQAGGRADRPVSPETIALVESLLADASQD